jgi:hypothetical protein
MLQCVPYACTGGCLTMEAAILARPAALFAPTTISTSACNAFRDTMSTLLEDAVSARLTAPRAPRSAAWPVSRATN